MVTGLYWLVERQAPSQTESLILPTHPVIFTSLSSCLGFLHFSVITGYNLKLTFTEILKVIYHPLYDMNNYVLI